MEPPALYQVVTRQPHGCPQAMAGGIRRQAGGVPLPTALASCALAPAFPGFPLARLCPSG